MTSVYAADADSATTLNIPSSTTSRSAKCACHDTVTRDGREVGTTVAGLLGSL